jgi:energy-coupling factor transport system ATP-binding protein
VRIELQGVGHVYFPGTPQEVKALDGLDLVVEDGEFLGLIGPTGSGKSTLAQCFCGLLRPSRGKVLVGGRDITAKGARADLKWVRQRVGMVFQFPEHQLFEDSVYADVAFGPRNLHLEPAEVDRRTRLALSAVGLDGEPGEPDREKLLGRSPFALSGGQMRRVAIAGVLAMEPEVLILDEPAAGLDPQGREEILGQIAAMHRERGITVVFISHNMEEVARLARRLVVLVEGRVAMDGSAAEVFARGDELRRFGLDVPVTVQVLEGLRKRGWTVPLALLDVERAAEAIAAALGARGGEGP